MTDDPSPAGGAEPAVADERRASTLELFFDLVFVFAFTQVTGMLAENPTLTGLSHAVLLLAIMWWAWGAYAWLTNAVSTEFLLPRLVLLASMAGFTVVALSVPEAFESAAVPFAVGILLVFLLHAVLYASAGGRLDRAGILRLAPTNVIASLLVLGAAFVPAQVRIWLWVVAVAVLYVGPFLSDIGRFRVHPTHFAERHSLIVIIAFGETIVAIGVGATADGTSVSGLELVAGLVTIALVSAMWWRYFDAEAARAEHALMARTGVARSRLARDVFSYLHMPLVGSIVLMAVGIKKTIGHPGDHLKTLPAILLCGGAALFLLMLAAMRLRRDEAIGWSTPVGIAGCLAVTPLAMFGPAIAAVGALAVIFAVIVIADMRAKYRRL
ncbi:low temperature requirement protein A [Phytomonospora endophytica]|uniref:Low temperature requirement protein LtrA n=1 Tax=Phytomonospora endophytica TaxID=714109 RepID=A0A841FPY2_9ACTN|nr:low temperature requirement protein A [Phytomonospora endophytica]MBB6035612.1 low temperature requirement protein LtrA [Phytomonospora endophytica]GIG70025.1 low temperature requirement protein A [Phytomonospora endophytica]